MRHRTYQKGVSRTLGFAVVHFGSATLLILFAALGPARGAEGDLVSWADADEPTGFASVAGSSTGGGNAKPTRVRTLAELKAVAEDPTPRVILISGTIKTTDGGGYALEIQNNKTLVGAGRDATIYGGIAINSASNIIVRNLNIHGTYPYRLDSADAVPTIVSRLAGPQ